MRGHRVRAEKMATCRSSLTPPTRSPRRLLCPSSYRTSLPSARSTTCRPSKAGMAAQRAEVEEILTDPAPPTEDNTLLALERSGRLLHRVSAVLWNVIGADSTPGLDAIEAEVAPLLSAHHDAIYLDKRLFDRLEALAARVDAGEVALPEDATYRLARLRRDLVRAGAALAPDQQATVRELNARISTLEAAFGRELLAESNDSAVLITDPAELAGLSDGEVAAARQAAADRGHAGGLAARAVLVLDPAAAGVARRARRAPAAARRLAGARGARRRSTTPARSCSSWPGSGPSVRGCSATTTTRPTSPPTAPRRPPPPSTRCSGRSRRQPRPTPGRRPRTWRRRWSRTSPARPSRAGTGRGTPSGSEPSGTRWTTRPCAPTSSSSASSTRASSGRRTSCTAWTSPSAPTWSATTRRSASSR